MNPFFFLKNFQTLPFSLWPSEFRPNPPTVTPSHAPPLAVVRRPKALLSLGVPQVIERRSLWPLISAPITDPGITALMVLLERHASKGRDAWDDSKLPELHCGAEEKES
ncbi:hypothetical protein ES332_A03G170500v1 [Gossypium tomentosum]|uniref:Uncharacterized protein n=1 Tax=Gossypium tomentosum TaxID=34277 RepID=A0A5D2R7J1_GOSTO|nr:hypothetical protein ES332_A03G170500v1 [Gossypium tomentosum]